jgi:hypothetical protein
MTTLIGTQHGSSFFCIVRRLHLNADRMSVFPEVCHRCKHALVTHCAHNVDFGFSYTRISQKLQSGSQSSKRMVNEHINGLSKDAPTINITLFEDPMF